MLRTQQAGGGVRKQRTQTRCCCATVVGRVVLCCMMLAIQQNQIMNDDAFIYRITSYDALHILSRGAFLEIALYKENREKVRRNRGGGEATCTHHEQFTRSVTFICTRTEDLRSSVLLSAVCSAVCVVKCEWYGDTSSLFELLNVILALWCWKLRLNTCCYTAVLIFDAPIISYCCIPCGYRLVQQQLHVVLYTQQDSLLNTSSFCLFLCLVSVDGNRNRNCKNNEEILQLQLHVCARSKK